jgi:mannose-6-phosphate isomerase-like protein (cupin superfamily)
MGAMNLKNINKATGSFEILQATEHSQTAVMRLNAGEASSDQLNTHPKSDQILMVIAGELTAEIEGEKSTMNTGDVVIVPAGAKHRFTNSGSSPALAFSAYAPPAY